MTTFIEVLQTLLFVIVWLVALAGHAILLKILLTPNERAKLGLLKKESFVSWLLLLNITVADLAALLLGLPFTTFNTIFDYQWPFGTFLCKVASFTELAATTFSTYALLFLLCYFSNLQATALPKIVAKHLECSSSGNLKAKQPLLVLGGLWATSVISALPPLFIFRAVKQIKEVEESTENPLQDLQEMLKVSLSKLGVESCGSSSSKEVPSQSNINCNAGSEAEMNFFKALLPYYTLLHTVIPLLVLLYLAILGVKRGDLFGNGNPRKTASTTMTISTVTTTDNVEAEQTPVQVDVKVGKSVIILFSILLLLLQLFISPFFSLSV